ncbi:uncharacterized protein E0L32_006316 [Thyridium curvatum]|uniref:AB hydrolase-1 domain-containing protein n=1 Tax=Thyridium curvatum TaxID=1093900 RepID=A0A507B0B9_9PEZI|nr:uncharacterized protein E0L32_006316 [Thyridium curvatum]TPX13343.1 hypothetical protein E0L32_006316 [Thyridium curvatum]
MPAGGSIFVRAKTDADKPPLLLIHGYPQTHVEWHPIIPALLPHFSVVLIDLRGYGQSSIVPSTNGSGYSKRLMAEDCIAVMAKLGYSKFSVMGHDRGARVTYRLAFDHPEVLTKAVVLDIIPTAAMFESFGNTGSALKAYHWLFLAQPAPFPEDMIKGADGGRRFVEHSLSAWTKDKNLDAFGAAAMDAYRKAYCDDARIHSTCEDYRAGAFLDRKYDEEELRAGRKIKTPLLAVWGATGFLVEGAPAVKTEGPLETWQKYAENVTGVGLECGHFIPEEDPEGLLEVLLPFLLEN